MAEIDVFKDCTLTSIAASKVPCRRYSKGMSVST